MELEDLMAATGATETDADKFIDFIDAAMIEFGIDTPDRQAMFLAQIGHESGGLHWLREIWGPTVAQLGYEGRLDLGNTEIGDGVRFRGRGLLQVTGRANYKSIGLALGLDLVDHPDLLELPENAARSAAYFWKSRGLNRFADEGDVKTCTRRINGGLNGYDQRLALYAKAQEALA